MSIAAESQKLEKDPLVSLYAIDFTPIGQNVIYNFTQNKMPDGSNVFFNGVEYEPQDVSAYGFEMSGTGTFPKPTLKVPNAGNLATSLIVSYGDITGSIFTRIRTYMKYLDGQAEGGNEVQYPPDIYYIEQRVNLNKTEAVWRMSSAMDFQGTKLPRRLALRDVCTRTYRIWDSAAGIFKYGNCPYVDNQSFDENNKPTANPALDRCSRKLQGCEVRFGPSNELPTWAFPALARTRA